MDETVKENDEIKELKAVDVIPKVSLNSILTVMEKEKDFSFALPDVTFKELERFKKYEVTVNYSENEEPIVDILEAQNDEEGREFRKMMKKPQTMYPAIISMTHEDGRDETKLLLHYEPGQHIRGVYELTLRLIDEYIIFKQFKTVEDAERYIHEVEIESDKAWMVQQDIRGRYGLLDENGFMSI